MPSMEDPTSDNTSLVGQDSGVLRAMKNPTASKRYVRNVKQLTSVMKKAAPDMKRGLTDPLGYLQATLLSVLVGAGRKGATLKNLSEGTFPRDPVTALFLSLQEISRSIRPVMRMSPANATVSPWPDDAREMMSIPDVETTRELVLHGYQVEAPKLLDAADRVATLARTLDPSDPRHTLIAVSNSVVMRSLREVRPHLTELTGPIIEFRFLDREMGKFEIRSLGGRQVCDDEFAIEQISAEQVAASWRRVADDVFEIENVCAEQVAAANRRHDREQFLIEFE